MRIIRKLKEKNKNQNARGASNNEIAQAKSHVPRSPVQVSPRSHEIGVCANSTTTRPAVHPGFFGDCPHRLFRGDLGVIWVAT